MIRDNNWLISAWKANVSVSSAILSLIENDSFLCVSFYDEKKKKKKKKRETRFFFFFAGKHEQKGCLLLTRLSSLFPPLFNSLNLHLGCMHSRAREKTKEKELPRCNKKSRRERRERKRKRERERESALKERERERESLCPHTSRTHTNTQRERKSAKAQNIRHKRVCAFVVVVLLTQKTNFGETFYCASSRKERDT